MCHCQCVRTVGLVTVEARWVRPGGLRVCCVGGGGGGVAVSPAATVPILGCCKFGHGPQRRMASH